MTELFAGFTSLAPVLLVLDDLHWADRSTLAMLRHLISSSAALRLMVIGTLRTNDQDVLAATMNELSGIWERPGTHRMQLYGLGVQEISDLLGLGGLASPRDGTTAVVAGELHRSTNGNPFFVSQIMQMWPDWRDTGAARQPSGSVRNRVPFAVQEVIRARLSRLPASVQMMLSAATVVGSAIPIEVLRRLTEAGASTDLVLRAVDVATADGLLIERAPGEFSFAHDLVREHRMPAWVRLDA